MAAPQLNFHGSDIAARELREHGRLSRPRCPGCSPTPTPQAEERNEGHARMQKIEIEQLRQAADGAAV